MELLGKKTISCNVQEKQVFSSVREFSLPKRIVCLYMCLPRIRHVLQRPRSARDITSSH